MAGLGIGLALFLLLAIVGLAAAVVLIFLQFATLVFAGYVAGRFSPGTAALNGGLAALTAFLVVGALAVASAASPSPLELVIFGLIAAVLGSAGGVLAEWRRHP